MKWSDSGDPWVGTDINGQYNNNCPDYDYFEFGRINFDEWLDEIERNSVLTIRSAGKNHKINLEEDGDEELNKVFFQWLERIVQELEAEGVFCALQRHSTFRLGVQMLDSECEAFWVSTN